MGAIVVRLGALGVFGCLLGASASGQAGTPTLLLQPGLATSDFVSSGATGGSNTGFVLRVVGIIPTRWSWLTPIVGVHVLPYGTSGAVRDESNQPGLFVGNVFPLVSRRHTGGWVSADVPLLLTYTAGGGGDANRRPYGRDVAIEAALTVHVGARLLSEFGGPLSRLRLYGILDQSLTPNAAIDGRRDRFNPSALYGVTIPFGTSRLSP